MQQALSHLSRHPWALLLDIHAVPGKHAPQAHQCAIPRNVHCVEGLQLGRSGLAQDEPLRMALVAWSQRCKAVWNRSPCWSHDCHVYKQAYVRAYAPMRLACLYSSSFPSSSRPSYTICLNSCGPAVLWRGGAF